MVALRKPLVRVARTYDVRNVVNHESKRRNTCYTFAVTALACILALSVLLFVMTGCSTGVREDRHINWSTQTGDVGFQHGEDGVYVAEGEDRRPEKIFDPGEDVIATSSPLWSPVDGRLIFAVARPPEGDEQTAFPPVADWDSAPEGREFQQAEVSYTCLLRAAAGEQDGQPPEPKPIFQASCDHVGYVAANLAVRWHPDGKRILFIDRCGEGQHSLFEFDLATRKAKQVLPWSAAALAFDGTPNGSYLACVSVADGPESEHAGIWIRSIADDGTWWKVPDSEQLTRAVGDQSLKRARSLRPAWTRDDRRFAYVARLPGETDEAPPEIRIQVVELASRKVTEVYRDSRPIRELRWHPQGDRLGFVQEGPEGDEPKLRMVDELGKLAPAVDTPPIRRFAGWNHSGTRLAYVSPDDVPTHRETNWAMLFLELPQPRDRVYVASGNGDDPGKMVFSGMRVTFPKWSPKEDELSLWCTYSPTHLGLLSLFVPASLRPGDPAAILDGETGKMHWMTINAREQAQVGHYYLWKRDYEQAWGWYEKAAEGRVPSEPIPWGEWEEMRRRLRAHQDVSFFEYYCLTQLGRHDEAREKLAQFRRAMTLDLRDVQPEDLLGGWQVKSEQQLMDRLRTVVQIATPLFQDSYIAEVYLSLDAADDGVAFFRRALDEAGTDHERLSRGLFLSQLLLITERHEQYARLITDSVAPLLLQFIQPADGDLAEQPEGSPPWPQTVQGQGLQFLAAGTLLPMFSPEFLATIPESPLEELVGSWRQLREQADDDIERAGIDLFLRAALVTLKRSDEQQVVEQRLDENPSVEDDFEVAELQEAFAALRHLVQLPF